MHMQASRCYTQGDSVYSKATKVFIWTQYELTKLFVFFFFF